MVDGELIFSTKIDQSGFDKGTKKISTGVDKLKSSLKGLSKIAASAMPLKGTRQFSRSLGGVNSQLKGLARSLAAAFSVKMVSDFVKSSQEAFAIQEQQEVKLTTIMRQRMGATDDVIDSVKQLASEQQALGVIGDEVQLAGAQQVATFLNESDSIKTLLPAMNDLLAQQRGFEASTGDAVNIANLMGKVLQGQTSALKRVGISFSEAEEQVLKYGTESQRAAMLAQVITNNVGHMNSALAQTDAGKQKQLANTMGDIKEQFGQAAMQIQAVFLPVLSHLVNGFSKVASMAQTVASAIRSAFGIESDSNSAAIATTTATAAADAAESYEDIADSTKSARKEQERSLASFDKIIKLSEPKTDSTSSEPTESSGGGGISLISDTKSPGEKVSTWADDIKKSIQNGQWGEIGTLLAKKINGIIDKVPWKNAGEKIGQGFTNAFSAAYGFLKNTNWVGLGSSLAEFFNGIVERTDFSLIGHTLGAKLNAMIGFAFGFVTTFDFAEAGLGLADLINGWFDEVNWEQLGDTIGGSIKGAIDFAFNFTERLDLQKIAKDFSTAFNRAVKKIDFKKLGKTVSNLFKGVWDFIGTALEEIDWENIGKAIGDFLSEIEWREILTSLFKVIGGVIKAMPELLKGIVESLDFDQAASLFGILFAPKLAGRLLNEFKTNGTTRGTLTDAGTEAGKTVGAGVEGQGSKMGSDLGSKLKAGLEAFAAGWAIGSWIYNKFKSQFDMAGEALGHSMADGIRDQIEDALDKADYDAKVKIGRKYEALGYRIDYSSSGALERSINNARVAQSYRNTPVTLQGGGYSGSKQTINSYYDQLKYVPRYATGTVVPANYGNFAAILGDNKKEPEVVSPLSTIEEAVRRAMGPQGGSKQPITINISLDTRKGTQLLSTMLIDDINDITRSTGEVPIDI